MNKKRGSAGEPLFSGNGKPGPVLSPVADVAVHDAEGPQYGQQDDRADNGDDQPADAEGADSQPEQHPGQPAADQRADDPDDDIGQSPLRPVSMHDHRSDPSGQGSEDDPQDNIQYHLSS